MNVITALHCVVNSAYVDLIKVTYFTTEGSTIRLDPIGAWIHYINTFSFSIGVWGFDSH